MKKVAEAIVNPTIGRLIEERKARRKLKLQQKRLKRAMSEAGK